MPALTLEDLSAFAGSLKAHPVPVPEWGEGRVAYVAELTADERDARLEVAWYAHKEKIEQESNVGLRAWQVAACWCNESREFVAKDAGGIESVAETLGKLDSRPVTRMFMKASEVNALTEADLEDLEKN